MSKRKKKKIKERKHGIRQFQKTAENILSAMEGKPVRIKENLAKKIGRNER